MSDIQTYIRPVYLEQKTAWDRVRPHLRQPYTGGDLFGPRWFSPPVALPGWRSRDGLNVLASLESAAGTDWLHASYSRAAGIPTHADTCLVRRELFPADAVVVAVFPPEGEYVNDHPRCLHLWSRIGGERLIPDLRSFDPLIGRVSI